MQLKKLLFIIAMLVYLNAFAEDINNRSGGELRFYNVNQVNKIPQEEIKQEKKFILINEDILGGKAVIVLPQGFDTTKPVYELDERRAAVSYTNARGNRIELQIYGSTNILDDNLSIDCDGTVVRQVPDEENNLFIYKCGRAKNGDFGYFKVVKIFREYKNTYSYGLYTRAKPFDVNESLSLDSEKLQSFLAIANGSFYCTRQSGDERCDRLKHLLPRYTISTKIFGFDKSKPKGAKIKYKLPDVFKKVDSLNGNLLLLANGKNGLQIAITYTSKSSSGIETLKDFYAKIMQNISEELLDIATEKYYPLPNENIRDHRFIALQLNRMRNFKLSYYPARLWLVEVKNGYYAVTMSVPPNKIALFGSREFKDFLEFLKLDD